jgi:energy-coupling factor transporter ATP-binding protein EcfA2
MRTGKAAQVHELRQSGKVLNVNGPQTFEMPSSDGRTTWTVTFQPKPEEKGTRHFNIPVEFAVAADFVAGLHRREVHWYIETPPRWGAGESPSDEAKRHEYYLRAVVRYCRRHLDGIVAGEYLFPFLDTKALALALGTEASDTLQAIEHEVDDVLDVLPVAMAEMETRLSRGETEFSLIQSLPVPLGWKKFEPNLRRMRDSDERIATAYKAAAEFYEVYQRHRQRLISAYDVGEVAADLGQANTLGHHAVRALFAARQPARAPTTQGRKAGTNDGWPANRAVHLSRITVENLRCFARVVVPFAPPEDTAKGQWIVLLGENGMGKTSILRALALALLPEDTARNHVYELSGRAGLVRNTSGNQHAHGRAARIDVDTGPGTTTVRIDQQRPRETLSIPLPLSERPLVLGYGCRRGSALGDIRRESNTDYLLGTATLFDEDARVIHADTWLRDIREQDRALFDAVCRTLCDLLIGVARISVERGGVTWAEGSIVGRVPLAGLSDGYLTTLGWLVDVLARWMDYAHRHEIPLGIDFHKRMPCVVLIDEIDLHLHPRWQTEVITKLRNTFPMTTFVATTHNPLTLHGTQPGEVHVIRAGEDGNLEIVPRDLPPGIGTDELLTGDWFGLPSTLDAETQQLLQQHFVLLQQGRPEGAPERVRLEEMLRQRLGHFAATPAEQLAQEIVAEQLDSAAQPVTDEDRARVRALYEQRVREAAIAGQGQQGDEP